MHYPLFDLSELFLILAFFVFPSLFSAPSESVSIPSSSDIPWLTVILYTLLVTYMAIRYHTAKKHSVVYGRKTKALSFLMYISSTLTTVLLLIAANFIVSKFASHYSGDSFQPDINVSAESLADNVFLVFWTALLASFEEFTYRWLLPERLISLWPVRLPEDSYTTTRKIICEAAVICLFALSHRYMGWWAVLNALLAGIILRTRYFISGSVYPALFAHILYNLTAFYGILTP